MSFQKRTQTKIFHFSFLLFAVIFSPFSLWAADLTPHVDVMPGTTVAVGQEVVFNAEGTTYAPDQQLVREGRFEWDFGDGYKLEYAGLPDSYGVSIRPNGIAMSHYFMKPGTYTVTLTAKVWSLFYPSYPGYKCLSTGCGTEFGVTYGPDVAADAIETTTIQIVVEGKEPLEGFEIEHAPLNNRTKQYVYVQVPQSYRTADYTLKLYTVDTTSEPDVTVELLSKNNPSSEESVLLDHTVLTPSHDYILRAQIVDGSNQQVVEGTKEGVYEVFFETPASTPITTIDENNTFSWKGDSVFPVYVYMLSNYSAEIQEWAKYANSWHTFQMGGGPTTWSGWVDSVESVDNSLMAIGPGLGDYAASIDSLGQRTTTGHPARYKMNHLLSRMSEFFSATKDKDSLFMIAIQDEPNMGGSHEKALTPTLAAWEYTAHNADPNHPAQVGFMGSEWLQNSSPSYNDYQGSAPLFGGKKWAPTTMGYDVFAASSVARFSAGTTTTNRTDMGPWWAYLEGKDRMRSFNSRTSKKTSTDYSDYRELIPMTGSVKPCANGVQKEINATYTISTGVKVFNFGPKLNIRAGQEISIGNFAYAVDQLINRMHGTVSSYDPVSGDLVANIAETTGSGTYDKWFGIVEYPSHVAGETTMQSWLEVVHGSKGILWFNYFDRPSMQLDEMANFKRQITELWPYIDGPMPSTVIADDKNEQLGRIDTMIRENEGEIYVVAVRVTEPPPEPAIAWVKIAGIPSTVIENGKVGDTDGNLWSIGQTVTIPESGAIDAMVTCDTLGDFTAKPFSLTTIATPVEGWVSVDNASAESVLLPDTSITILQMGTFTINVGAGKSFEQYRHLAIGLNDSPGTLLTHVMKGNVSSYNSETGELTVVVTSAVGSGTYTNWRIDQEWFNQVVNGSRYTGVEPETITATFTISDRVGNENLTVYDEGRAVTAVDGVFTDTFSKNDVHIYSTSPVSSSLQADFDSDSDVDIFDYNILLTNFGTTGDCENPADADGDCNVGIFDYNILLGEFGSGA